MLDAVIIGVISGAWDNLLFLHKLLSGIVTAASGYTIFVINTHVYSICLLCWLIIAVAIVRIILI